MIFVYCNKSVIGKEKRFFISHFIQYEYSHGEQRRQLARRGHKYNVILIDAISVDFKDVD
jgi:hypothetical protein